MGGSDRDQVSLLLNILLWLSPARCSKWGREGGAMLKHPQKTMRYLSGSLSYVPRALGMSRGLSTWPLLPRLPLQQQVSLGEGACGCQDRCKGHNLGDQTEFLVCPTRAQRCASSLPWTRTKGVPGGLATPLCQVRHRDICSPLHLRAAPIGAQGNIRA